MILGKSAKISLSFVGSSFAEQPPYSMVERRSNDIKKIANNHLDRKDSEAGGNTQNY